MDFGAPGILLTLFPSMEEDSPFSLSLSLPCEDCNRKALFAMGDKTGGRPSRR